MNHDEGIGEAVEAVSFDDTLGEIGKVVEGGLSEDRVIPVSSIDMYEVIAFQTTRKEHGRIRSPAWTPNTRLWTRT